MENFKVRCVKEIENSSTKGRIYEIKDGILTLDSRLISGKFNNVDEVNAIHTSRFELVEEKMFCKSDLKTGMRVETRDGSVYVILLGTENDGDVLVNKSWMSLTDYDDSLILISSYYHNLDIAKVYKQPYLPVDLFNIEKCGALLWERIIPLQYTVSEAQAELSKLKGKEVQIIKE